MTTREDFAAEQAALRGYALTLLGNLERSLAEQAKERTAYTSARQAAIPPVVAQVLDQLEARHIAALAPLQAREKLLRKDLLYAVTNLGESVNGKRWCVRYVPAAPMWDVAGLEAYAATHPEIQRFRKNGRASAQLESLEE